MYDCWLLAPLPTAGMFQSALVLSCYHTVVDVCMHLETSSPLSTYRKRDCQQQQLRSFHLTGFVADQDTNGEGPNTQGKGGDGAVGQVSNEKRYPTKLSMSEEDKPDFFDLVSYS